MRWLAGLLLAQERLSDGGGRDGLFALLLGALECTGEASKFASQSFGLAQGRVSGVVREGAGLLGHSGRGDRLFAPMTFAGQRLA
jgi:hypothetical protein